jgi:hypothetical protein
VSAHDDNAFETAVFSNVEIGSASSAAAAPQPGPQDHHAALRGPAGERPLSRTPRAAPQFGAPGPILIPDDLTPRGQRAGAKEARAAGPLPALVVVGTQPRVWRRLLVRETMWLSRLHDSIQIAFDWFDYQTHAFALDDLKFGNPVKRDELNVEDDRDVTLADLNLVHRDRMTYEYQIGEGWQVDVRVEKAPPGKGALYPSASPASARARPRTAADSRPSTTCWPASRSPRPTSARNGSAGWGPSTTRAPATWTR